MFIEIAPYWNKISFPKPFCNLNCQLKRVNRSILVFSRPWPAVGSEQNPSVTNSWLPSWARTKGFKLENCRALLNRLALLYQHRIAWIGWLPLISLNLSKISDCWLFTVLKTLTGCRSVSHSEHFGCPWTVPDKDENYRYYLLPCTPFFVIFESNFNFRFRKLKFPSFSKRCVTFMVTVPW